MAASPDAVLHLAALHSLSQAGFASTSRVASLSLSTVLARYLSLVGSTCTERAAAAGRSKVVATDVVQALEDLGMGGVGELQEWTADLDKQSIIVGGKMEDLATQLSEGLLISEGFDLNFVPVQSDEEEESSDEGDGDDDSNEAEEEDVTSKQSTSKDESLVKPGSNSEQEAVSPKGVASPPTLKVAEEPASSGQQSPRQPSPRPSATSPGPAAAEKTTTLPVNGSATSSKDAATDGTDDSQMVLDEPSPPEQEIQTPPQSPSYLRVDYRPRSPDLSWLPPIPSEQVKSDLSGAGAVTEADAVPAPQSVAERYRQPVAYSTSQLAEVHQFEDPVRTRRRSEMPQAPSSFPSLIATYSAVSADPSVALRQTDGRRQAADLLRLTVANPEVFSPRDSLAQPLPPPHLSPIVPSHSDSTTPKLLPVNPNQNGMITSLLHQIRSPYLPPTLRERLTSLRPPQLQSSDQGPALFGEPVRGADEAALAKARGKATGEETEVFFRATWDSGPRGAERFTKGQLPSGRKVIQYVEGDMIPRESDGAKALRIKLGAKGDPHRLSPGPSVAQGPGSGGGIKLRLGGAPKSPNGTESSYPTSYPDSYSTADQAESTKGLNENGGQYGAPDSTSLTSRRGSHDWNGRRESHDLNGSGNKRRRGNSRSISPIRPGTVSPIKQG